jgi:hypothetical protein
MSDRQTKTALSLAIRARINRLRLATVLVMATGTEKA